MRLISAFVTAYIIVIFAACGNGRSEEDNARNEVERFAKTFFNYDLKTAQEYCTLESRRWIEYIATNIGEDDIEVLRSKEDKAEVTVKSIILDNDSAGTATIAISNYLRLDTIGKAGTISDLTSVRMQIVKRNGRWMVDIRKAFPLQNGTRDHD